MAKAVVDNIVVSQPWRSWLKVVAVGAGVGVVAWLLTWLIAQYIVEPITCRQLVDAALCVNSTPIAGNIANVLASVAALIVMVRLRFAQPMVIVVIAMALLWDLTAWTQGLSRLETLGWFIGLYALSYGLFAWIARATRTWVVLTIALVLALAIRIVVLL